MNRTLIISIIIILPTTVEAQSIRPSIIELANKISKVNELEQFENYYRQENVFEYYRILSNDATLLELESLTNHQNPVVRCYAYRSLTDRNYPNLLEIIIDHLKDTTKFTMYHGDRLMKKYVGDYFIEITHNPIIPNSEKVYGTNKLNQIEQNVLDSSLIFQDSVILFAKQNLLWTIKPRASYYDRIRQIATKENNPVGIIALSRFNNKNDIELIKELFKSERTEYFAALSVREFPDTAFYRLLVNLFEKDWSKTHYFYDKWKFLYQALAKYPRPETIELFERTAKTQDKFKYETLCKYLLVAISKYPNELYDPIKAKIILPSYQMDEVKDELENEF